MKSQTTKNSISPSRLRHSRAVSRLAGELAVRYGWKKHLAEQAGLWHDCARDWSKGALLRYIKTHGLKAPHLAFMVKRAPGALHALVGAHWLKHTGLITDRASLRAIAHHTLGGRPMDKPGRILFVADFASYDRPYKEAKLVRTLAKRSLNLAFNAAFQLKFEYHLRQRKPIAPDTLEVWNRSICGVK